MKYKILAKPYEEYIEARNVEDAMISFATRMELDMNIYFQAVPIDNETEDN